MTLRFDGERKARKRNWISEQWYLGIGVLLGGTGYDNEVFDLEGYLLFY